MSSLLLNFPEFFQLVVACSSEFLTSTSCCKITHARDYCFAWPSRPSPLTLPWEIPHQCSIMGLKCLQGMTFFEFCFIPLWHGDAHGSNSTGLWAFSEMIHIKYKHRTCQTISCLKKAKYRHYYCTESLFNNLAASVLAMPIQQDITGLNYALLHIGNSKYYNNKLIVLCYTISLVKFLFCAEYSLPHIPNWDTSQGEDGTRSFN